MMKIARNVHFKIQDGKDTEFNRLFTSEVLPLLKQQKGFKDELTLVNKDGALGISLWADKPSADAYQANTYTKVLDKLNPVLLGTPRVDTYEVAVSTLHV